MAGATAVQVQDDMICTEPTLGDVLLGLWAARLWLLGGALSGLCGAVLFLSLAVPQYRASMIVSPATLETVSALPAALPENTSFAIETLFRSMNPRESADFIQFETILFGESVAGLLLQDEAIRKGLEGVRRFDVGAVSVPRDAAEMSVWLDRNLVVLPVRDTPLKEISLLHPSPIFGPYFLSRLHELADSHIRKAQQERIKTRIAWLKEKLAVADQPQHRRALAALLVELEQQDLILAIDEPYAALVTEAPAVSPKPYWPRKSLVFAIFIFAGMFLSFAFYSLRQTQRSRPSASSL